MKIEGGKKIEQFIVLGQDTGDNWMVPAQSLRHHNSHHTFPNRLIESLLSLLLSFSIAYWIYIFLFEKKNKKKKTFFYSLNKAILTNELSEQFQSSFRAVSEQF